MAKVGNLIVLGTYEEFVLGYALVPDEANEKKLSLVQTFACHSHKASVRSLAVGGIHLASGSTDETIRLYDILNQVESGLLTHHSGTVNALAFTENGSHLISAGDDGVIAIVRTGSWFTEKKWVGTHSGSAVTGLSVHPSGKLALSIGSDNRIVTWNLVKGRKAYITNASSRCQNGWGIGDVQWSPSGSHYAVFMSSHAEVYSVAIAGVSHTISCSNRVTCIAFLSDDIILVGEESGEASIHKLKSPTIEGQEGEKEELFRFQAHDRRVKCAKLLGSVEDRSRDAIQFVTAGGNGYLCLWEFEELEVIKVCDVKTGCRITCMTVVDLDRELKIKKETAMASEELNAKKLDQAKMSNNENLQNGGRKRKVSDSFDRGTVNTEKPSPKIGKKKHISEASTSNVKSISFERGKDKKKPTSSLPSTQSSKSQGKKSPKVKAVNSHQWVVTPLQ